MTDKEILNTYGIIFSNKISDYDSGRKTYKKVNATNGSLYRYLNDWKNIFDIDNFLLPVVNHVLNDPGAEETSDSDTEWVELDHSFTKIWYTGNPHDDDKPDCLIPTEHFKMIILSWRQFLTTPPLNGSKVA